MSTENKKASLRSCLLSLLTGHWPLVTGHCSLLTLLLLLAGCGGGGGGVTVTGIVSQADSSPTIFIENALVIIGGKTALTDADGKFTVSGIPNGQTQPITVSKTGYTVYDQADLPLDVAQPLNIALTLVGNDSFGTVKGSLLDDGTGRGIGLAEVNVGALFGGEVLQWFTGHTADDGQFELSGIPTGQATVEVTLTGYSSFSQEIPVIAGDGTDSLTIRLSTAPVPVSGTVFDVEDRTPIQNATVEVEGQQQVTDAAGNFSFSAVPLGNRTFTVSAEGYQTAQRSVLVEAGMQPLAFAIAKVGSGPPALPYTLTGTVTLGDLANPSGATVSAADQSSGEVMDTAAADQNGLYYLWLPAGNYDVTATKSAYQSITLQASLLPTEVKTLDFMLPRAGN